MGTTSKFKAFSIVSSFTFLQVKMEGLVLFWKMVFLMECKILFQCWYLVLFLSQILTVWQTFGLKVPNIKQTWKSIWKSMVFFTFDRHYLWIPSVRNLSRSQMNKEFSLWKTISRFRQLVLSRVSLSRDLQVPSDIIKQNR